jgi:hypothetical protein
MKWEKQESWEQEQGLKQIPCLFILFSIFKFFVVPCIQTQHMFLSQRGKNATQKTPFTRDQGQSSVPDCGSDCGQLVLSLIPTLGIEAQNHLAPSPRSSEWPEFLDSILTDRMKWEGGWVEKEKDVQRETWLYLAIALPLQQLSLCL